MALNRLSVEWGRFSAGVCGAKLHVIYDPDADRPIYAAVNKASVNDITVAQTMPIMHPRPLMCMTSATMTTPGGPNSMPPNAGSSPA